MKRLAMFLLVGVLATMTAGILDLVIPEPCSPAESASAPADGDCPPTCGRCHCARAFDVALHIHVGDASTFTPDWTAPLARIPQPAPHDILHVPRSTHSAAIHLW